MLSQDTQDTGRDGVPAHDGLCRTSEGLSGDAGLRVASPLRTRVLRATTWRMSAYFVGNAFRLGSNIILAHLLFPAAFGIVALATVVVRGLSMFSELGIGPAIIQSNREDMAFLNTAWTMQFLRGMALWGCTVLLAWPISWFYGEPLLLWMVPVLGLTALIAGLNSTSVFTLNRHLIEGRRSVIEVGQNVLTRGVAVVWAWVCPTPWALVGGTLVGAVSYCASTHLLVPNCRNRFRWDTAVVKALTHFGSWILVGTIITFFGQQIDRLVLAKLEPLELLGLYTISLTVARMPLEVAQVLADHILYPLLASLSRNDNERFPEQVLSIRRVVLTCGVVAVSGSFLAAPLLFNLFYDVRYAGAGGISQLAVVAAWLGILVSSADRTLLALGNTRSLAVSSLVTALGTTVGCFVGYATLHVPGFVLGTAVGPAAGLFVIQSYMLKHGIFIFGQDAAYTALAILPALIGEGLSRYGSRVFGHQHAYFVRLVVCLVVVGGLCVWALRKVYPVLFKDRRTQAK